MTVMAATDFATPYQALAQFRDHTGQVYTVKPFERVISVKVDGNEAALLLEVFIAKERARGWSITGHGRRLISYQRIGAYWRKIGVLDDLEDDFEPFEVVNFGTHKSVEDYVQQVWWERDCHRPGNRANPMDNYSRSCDGYSSDATVRVDMRKVKF